VPITGGLGVKEAAIPPRRVPRGAGRIAPRSRAQPRGDELGQPLLRPAVLGAEARPPRPHYPPREEANLSPARAAEIEVHRPHPGDEQTERLPDTSEINTPTRMQTSLLRNNGEYDWRAPVKEAILDQAAGANIDPVLLQLSIQEPPGDSVRLQNLIDQDLLELLPPAERNVRRVQTSQQRQVAQSSRAKRRAAYSRIQALYKSSRTSCAKVVLAGKWREVAPTLSMQEQVAFWKPLLETPAAPDRRPPPSGRGT
jgi:hypothetical protein